MKDAINYLDMYEHLYGNLERVKLNSDVLKDGMFTLNTVKYEDIDNSFKEWVDNDLRIISQDGKKFPTMSLFTNQRFSEYSQTWSYTDSNNNLMLNFKTVSRSNDPKYGNIQNGYFNIPYTDFKTVRKLAVMDDNGKESLLVLGMKQPVAVDMEYDVSIFTNSIKSVNDFNIIINRLFQSKQCYIAPNGYYMPMTLEGISDQSEHSIDDRQFYSQQFKIKVMGYLITEENFRVEEKPIVGKYSISTIRTKQRRPTVEYEIEEEKNDEGYRSAVITWNFSSRVNIKPKRRVVLPIDFRLISIETDNVQGRYELTVNGRNIGVNESFDAEEGDEIELKITKINPALDASFKMIGYDKNSSEEEEELEFETE